MGRRLPSEPAMSPYPAGSEWFARMGTIETYQQDPSAMSRIYMWNVTLRIVEEHPIVGGF
jgi:O-antigen ligase